MINIKNSELIKELHEEIVPKIHNTNIESGKPKCARDQVQGCRAIIGFNTKMSLQGIYKMERVVSGTTTSCN